MARDVVIKVREAEERGAAIVKRAHEEAAEIAAAAEREAAEACQAAQAGVRSFRSERAAQALAKAETECARLEAANEDEIKNILNPAPDRLKKAVDAVVGRIVN